MAKEFLLQPGALTLADLRRVLESHVPVKLPKTAYAAMAKSEKAVADVIAQGRTVYGSTPVSVIWQKSQSPRKKSDICSVIWCCPMRRGWQSAVG